MIHVLEARLVEAIELMAKAIARQSEQNDALLRFLCERDAGWMKLHSMEAELREVNYAFDLAVTKARGELIKQAGDEAIKQASVVCGNYALTRVLEKLVEGKTENK
jgi:hypothetical protein